VPDPSPLGWNAFAVALPDGGSAAASLAADVRRGFVLNGALADAAIAAWGAKRVTQAPRPVSMIHYLASQGALPSSDAAWQPPVPTPASPGGISEDAAFAAAAEAALGARADGRAALLERLGLRQGIDLPSDVVAGRRAGHSAAAAARAAAGRYLG
jgi:hypothetical protein